MQKDLKIGLILGLAIVSVAGLVLATRPSLTPQARLLDAGGPESTVDEEPRLTRDPRGPASAEAGGRQNHRPSSTAKAPIRRAVSEGVTERNRLAVPAVHVQPKTIQPERFHIVRKDETLSEISYAYYGSAGKWRKIFEANRTTIKNADVVRAGTKLIIPN